MPWLEQKYRNSVPSFTEVSLAGIFYWWKMTFRIDFHKTATHNW